VTTLRPAKTVMRLSRLGSLHQCRLSFMRQLTRRMAREGWRFSRPVFEINDQGEGHAVYTAAGPERSYSLVAFAHDLPDHLRSDRVIAEAWDATFALFDGVPEAQDIDRLAANVPLQEAGRVSERELSLSRANRSVRLWAHVVAALADGRQPDVEQIDRVGYLMRTTAVYGSGKFGAADRDRIADRAEMSSPFQAEMLSVYLTRAFVRDLVEHIAGAKGGDKAVPLDRALAERLGIGNSTGLGMAPFLINHPLLLNNWIMARERAIATVRGLVSAEPEAVAGFRTLLHRAAHSVENWHSEHPIQVQKLADLRADTARLTAHLEQNDLTSGRPWDKLMIWAETALTLEGQEWLASLILEPYADLVDGFGTTMDDPDPEAFHIDGTRSLGAVRDLLEARFGWAGRVDWSARDAIARAWYVSEEKLEPRLGERFEEPIADYEQPLAPARDAARALADMAGWDADQPIAAFLLGHPEHRPTSRRTLIGEAAPYSEILDNTIASDVLPIDMLRAKLSFFGATRFDPRSDRWVRIAMYTGAPYPADLSEENADLWVYPEGAS